MRNLAVRLVNGVEIRRSVGLQQCKSEFLFNRNSLSMYVLNDETDCSVLQCFKVDC